MNIKVVFFLLIHILFSKNTMSQVNEALYEANKKLILVDKDKYIHEDIGFNTPVLINSQTTEVLGKNVLEVLYEQRFGSLNAGVDELYGIVMPHNIRLGLAFGLTNKSTLSIGLIKFHSLVDVGYKHIFIKQNFSRKIPLTVAYYGNITTSLEHEEEFKKVTDRISYFNQLVFSRKFGKSFSIFVAPGFMYYHFVDSANCSINKSASISIGSKLNIAKKTSIILEYGKGHLIKECKNSKSKPGLSFGLESIYNDISCQIFATTFREISEQDNYMYNQNDFLKGEILFGFNIALKINKHSH
jgi:hypothetical protein